MFLVGSYPISNPLPTAAQTNCLPPITVLCFFSCQHTQTPLKVAPSSSAPQSKQSLPTSFLVCLSCITCHFHTTVMLLTHKGNRASSECSGVFIDLITPLLTLGFTSVLQVPSHQELPWEQWLCSVFCMLFFHLEVQLLLFLHSISTSRTCNAPSQSTFLNEAFYGPFFKKKLTISLFIPKYFLHKSTIIPIKFYCASLTLCLFSSPQKRATRYLWSEASLISVCILRV